MARGLPKSTLGRYSGRQERGSVDGRPRVGARHRDHVSVSEAAHAAPQFVDCFRAGVTAYMKHLANEVGSMGITVNCVAPALIDTSHRSGSAAYTPAQSEARKKLTPLGRMGTQEEVCGVVAFLASMQAGFVTGSTLQVEGGMIGAMI